MQERVQNFKNLILNLKFFQVSRFFERFVKSFTSSNQQASERWNFVIEIRTLKYTANSRQQRNILCKKLGVELYI